MFNNTKYSDVSIYLGSAELLLPAHHAILGVRSPYFDDALESGFKEGKEREFRFHDYSVHALWRVFHFMYEGCYYDEPAESLSKEGKASVFGMLESTLMTLSGDDLELLKHPRVFALADMFRMDDLKALAVRNLEAQLQKHWISDTFPDCVREVYGNTAQDDAALRKIVVEVVKDHSGELCSRKVFLDVIRESGDFAVDVVKKLARV